MQNGYESIAYNKDLLTGELIEKIKMKEDKGIKGKITVSLYEGEEKVKEAYTENLIPDKYFKDTFIRQFMGGMMGIGSRTSSNSTWFDYLYLTDSDKPELPTDDKVEGNVIGYAHRNTTYSGTDAKRGSINLLENRFEIVNNKVRVNLVFDFQTHAANGRIESLYFCLSLPEEKDYMHIGPIVWGRNKADGNSSFYPNVEPKKYYALYRAFLEAKNYEFISYVKGFMILDFSKVSLSQSIYMTCPERLKGHMVYMPFDLNTEDILIWDDAVNLLDEEGGVIENLTYAVHCVIDEQEIIGGYYAYTSSSRSYAKLYTWSKVGVLLSEVTVDLSELLKDKVTNTLCTVEARLGRALFTEGCIEVIGYTRTRDAITNEYIYENIWGRVNLQGELIQRMDITPKFGNSTWFSTKGMDSSNIKRKAYVDEIVRSKNKFYFRYYGTQGGTSFWQCIDYNGNVIEPYRQEVGLEDSESRVYRNILGTDEWLIRYRNSYSSYCVFRIESALISRPIGTHTRLAESIEKTEANTMKVQYMFEVDLVSY